MSECRPTADEPIHTVEIKPDCVQYAATAPAVTSLARDDPQLNHAVVCLRLLGVSSLARCGRRYPGIGY